MKLFLCAATCSLGIHVLLEELGQPYETQAVDVRAGQQHQPDYVGRNPKAKVPLLERDDGSLLSEYGAISAYLAYGTPLALSGREAVARGIEAMDYIVGTIHMQGFTRVFRPALFTPNAADEDAVKKRGRSIVRQGFAVLAATLDGREYLFGGFSHVDCALFYVGFWAGRAGIAMPAAVADHQARMRGRPAVARALAAEGLS